MNRSQGTLAVRALFELLSLLGLAVVGLSLGTDVLELVLAVILPVAAAAVWAVFRVPGDPGDALIPVPGPVRLLLEIALLVVTTGLVWVVNQPVLAVLIGGLGVLQFGLGYERVIWLVRMGVRLEDPRDPRA